MTGQGNGKPIVFKIIISEIVAQAIKIQYEKDSGAGATRRDKIFLQTEGFEHFSRSHIEFLHILHNAIQLDFFGHSAGYNYAEESKGIEWYRILSGRKSADM